MDPVRNPYSPGAGSPPPELAGRGKLREQVRVAIARIRIGNPSDRLLAIRRLAACAPGLRGAGEGLQTNSGVLKHLVDAARRQGAQSIEEFQEAVRRSASVLSPFGEPLMVLNFTEHRWVAGHREEAYSDWLQWIMAQADAVEVLRVFGVNDPGIVLACTGTAVMVVRERCVLHGHEGSAGRLDLEIRLGDTALLIVEVKLGGAENADTEKGTGYCRSMEIDQHDARFKKYVILVLDAADEEYYGFKPRLWTDVCVELRLMAARLCKRREHLRAAMILAFITAAEQNLVKLRPVLQGGGDEVAAALTLPRITGHITRFLEAFEDGEKNRL